MDGENAMKSKKGMALKIIIPILLVCIVVGIWAVKNNKKVSGSVEIDYSDFALHVIEKIDLEKLKSYGLPIVIDFGADSCIPRKIRENMFLRLMKVD